MKLSMGSLFPSSKRSAKKKPRSPSISGSSNSSSSSSLDGISSRRRSSTPRSVLPPSPGDLFPSDLARITPRQLESAIRRLSPDPPPPAEADLAAVIAGEISLDDLLSLGAPAGDDEIRDAFAVFDTDGDGRISAEELRRVLVALGDDGCSIDDCRRMIREVDTDGDGFVCFDDFVRMMNGHK